MLEQTVEVERVWNGVMGCVKLEYFTSAEREAVKTLRNPEKKQQRLQFIEKLDSTHLSFRIEVDEAHEKLTTVNVAVGESKKYKNAGKAEGTAPPNDLEVC